MGYQADLLTNWEPMLGHQLPSLLSIDVYMEALPDFFSWLEKIVISTGAVSITSPALLRSVTGKGEIYRPRYGQLRLTNMSGGSLEIIRFAAGNRLCVDLQYQGTVSLGPSGHMKPYLFAVKSQTGEIRGYRVDRIESASITNQLFRPRYQIELSPISQLSAPRRFGNSSSEIYIYVNA